jgi:hypothetical protein
MLYRSTFHVALFSAGALLWAAAPWALATDTQPAETKEQRDARMEWWREARFGMFIHWGLYAIPAGEWKGKTFPPGGGEWIMNTANIPIDEYAQLARRSIPRSTIQPPGSAWPKPPA